MLINNHTTDWPHWMFLFESKIRNIVSSDDLAHDILHFKRVVQTAKKLCAEESALPEIVIPAAWLHDIVIIPKSDPRRSIASRLAAEEAIQFLTQVKYPEIYFSDIAHAIEAHSYSANIKPETLEAKIVQDADRLDALGAIGIARCIAVSTQLKRPLYSEQDPFCETRKPDDKTNTIDHFYTKLFHIAETMQTRSGKTEAQRRVKYMKFYLQELSQDIT